MIDKRYCSIIDSLRESLKEVKEYKKGNKKLKTWKEYINNKQCQDLSKVSTLHK